MVTKGIAAWVGSNEALETHLSKDAVFLDPAYQRLSEADVLSAWATLDPKTVQITPEFSRTLITQDALQMRLTLDENLITRVDMTHVNPPVVRQAIFYGYDGSRYYGSQVQPDHPTVQGAIEGILSHLFQKAMMLYPASRTDAGVHALDAVAHVDAPFYMAPKKLLRLMRKMAPDDIVIHDVKDVSPFFHARYDVISKTYQYLFTTQKDVHSMHKKSHLEISDIPSFFDRLSLFQGTHDFQIFAKSKDLKSSVRTIHSITWTEKSPHAWEVEITGDGFLRHMIRMMIGAAMTLTSETIKQGLKDPTVPIKKTLAPPEGLYLKTLVY